MNEEFSGNLIKGLVISLYFDKININDVLLMAQDNKELLEKVITELIRRGYDDIVEKLLIEQSRNYLEYCYNLD